MLNTPLSAIPLNSRLVAAQVVHFVISELPPVCFLYFDEIPRPLCGLDFAKRRFASFLFSRASDAVMDSIIAAVALFWIVPNCGPQPFYVRSIEGQLVLQSDASHRPHSLFLFKARINFS